MITCRRAAELVSKSMEEDLSLTEQLSLKLHLFICECCEQFRKQLDLLRGVLRAVGDGGTAKLDQDAKARIREAMEKERG